MSYATGLFYRHYTNFTLLNTTSAVKISIRFKEPKEQKHQKGQKPIEYK